MTKGDKNSISDRLNYFIAQKLPSDDIILNRMKTTNSFPRPVNQRLTLTEHGLFEKLKNFFVIDL